MTVEIPILLYHIVDDLLSEKEKDNCVTKESFEKQVKYLARKGYKAISLKELCDAFTGSTQLPEKPIIISFDDGYKDNYINAFPVLKDYGFTATIFIVTGLIGSTNIWDKDRGFPQRPLLSWHEIEHMKGYGISFEAHTHSHQHLTKVNEDRLILELVENKEIIENRLGGNCDFFAYPYGEFNNGVRKKVDELGFRAACSVRVGLNRTGDDLLALKRIPAFDWDTPYRLHYKLTLGIYEWSLPVILRYYLNRLREKTGIS